MASSDETHDRWLMPACAEWADSDGMRRASLGRGQFTFLPSKPEGWWSLALLAAAPLFLWFSFALPRAMHSHGFGGMPGFFSDPWMWVPRVGAGLSGVGAGVAAALAIVRRGERSPLVFVALLIGVFVLLFWAGEILAPH